MAGKPGNPNWHKGMASPNPSGLSKGDWEVIKAAREHTPRAIERLAELMESPDEQVAVAACKAMLDRGHGRAPETVNVNLTRDVRELPRERLLAIAAGAEHVEH